MQKFTLVLEIEVDDGITEDIAARELEEALKPLAAKVRSAATVKILGSSRGISRPRGAGDLPVSAGYESRLWEKATC